MSPACLGHHLLLLLYAFFPAPVAVQNLWRALRIEWSPQLQPLVAALSAKLRADMLRLVGRAYSNLSPAKLAVLLGAPEAQAVQREPPFSALPPAACFLVRSFRGPAPGSDSPFRELRLAALLPAGCALAGKGFGLGYPGYSGYPDPHAGRMIPCNPFRLARWLRGARPAATHLPSCNDARPVRPRLHSCIALTA